MEAARYTANEIIAHDEIRDAQFLRTVHRPWRCVPWLRRTVYAGPDNYAIVCPAARYSPVRKAAVAASNSWSRRERSRRSWGRLYRALSRGTHRAFSRGRIREQHWVCFLRPGAMWDWDEMALEESQSACAAFLFQRKADGGQPEDTYYNGKTQASADLYSWSSIRWFPRV